MLVNQRAQLLYKTYLVNRILCSLFLLFELLHFEYFLKWGVRILHKLVNECFLEIQMSNEYIAKDLGHHVQRVISVVDLLSYAGEERQLIPILQSGDICIKFLNVYWL